MVKAFGSITFNGQEYVMLEPEVMDNNRFGEAAYFARAAKSNDEPDEDGFVPYYLIEWPVLNEHGEVNWNKPERISGPEGLYSIKEDRFI